MGKARAFTLIELLVVISIMGLMAALSFPAYRSMRRGMEENSVLQNASQFLRLACQRAEIDRAPVTVYFWNETTMDESIATETLSADLVVAGHAVAVRQMGRITRIENGVLYDEFGDLAAECYVNEDGETEDEDPSATESGRRLFRVCGADTTYQSTLVKPTTVRNRDVEISFMTYPVEDDTSGGDRTRNLLLYGFKKIGSSGVQWSIGDPYGLEFAELVLPSGYIFGSGGAFSTSVKNPVYTGLSGVRFDPMASSLNDGFTIAISALRPNASGELAGTPIGTTTAPKDNLRNQNQK